MGRNGELTAKSAEDCRSEIADRRLAESERISRVSVRAFCNLHLPPLCGELRKNGFADFWKSVTFSI